MFGLGFGELCVLLVVATVVLGPKELPRHLRKAGQLAGRLRRLAFEMREKSGIDEVLRTEGIDREIAEIRKLARGEIGGIVSSVRSANDATLASGPPATTPYGAEVPAAVPASAGNQPSREYPPEGADSYGALPDTAVLYPGALPASPLANDAIYGRTQAPAESNAPALPPPTGTTS